MVKKSKNPQKSQKKNKNKKNSFFFRGGGIVFCQKKCYPLSFPILVGIDLTRAFQSSPFQKYKNLRKSFFSSSFFKIFFSEKKKKKDPILLIFQYQEDTIRPEFSSPARFRIQGGSTSMTDGGQRTNEGNPCV